MQEPTATTGLLEQMDTTLLYEHMAPDIQLLQTAQKLSDKLEQLDSELIATLAIPAI